MATAVKSWLFLLATFSSFYTTVECSCNGDCNDTRGTFNLWFIFMAGVFLLMCCCGAASYYCRRRNTASRGRPLFFAYPPDGVLQEPGIYYPPGVVPGVPVAPPAYDNLASDTRDVTVPPVQPGSLMGQPVTPGHIVDMDSNIKPPSYAEIFGTNGRPK